MGSLWQDVRYALRMMAKTPALTVVLAITLALGIGASTTIFSVVHSIVLRPLPYQQPDRIVRVYTEFHGATTYRNFSFSIPELLELKRDCRSCALVGGWVDGTAPLAGGDRPVRITVSYATHDLLPLLGVRPVLGRWFDANEDLPAPPTPGQLIGEPSVAVISYSTWQRAFGGDKRIIGRKVELDAIPVTVIGVMPKGFDFLGGSEAWVPGHFDPMLPRRASHLANVIVRLAPGATLASLSEELAALSKRWGVRDTREFHTIRDTHPMVAVPFQRDLVGSLATTLWLLQGAVLFVLLISIVNVANLLLARAETRTREVAVRHALGASRRRLVRQFITESLVLGLVGGALGVLVSVWAIDGVTALIPKSAPRAAEIRLDTTTVLFAVGCSLFAALLFGLAPILHARKSDLHGALKAGARSMTSSKARLRARRVLVILEIALAMLLVIGCTVMVRSFVRLQRVELGFKPERMLTFGVNLPLKTYQPAAANAFWTRLEDRLRALPGIESATMLDSIPPQRGRNIESLNFPGRTRLPIEHEWNVDYWQLSGPKPIELLGGRIVRGRDLDDRDVDGAPRVIVVNEAFVHRFFPHDDPIGREVTTYPGPDPKRDKPARIVGVFADMKNNGVDKPAGTEIIMPRAQYATLDDPQLAPLAEFGVLRTKQAPEQLIPAVTRAVAELDPSAPLFDVRTMDQLMWESVSRPRFLTFLLSCFAFVALLLAAVGIYGVMAHTVALRTHEIGLRVALGAQPKQVRAMVLRQAGLLVAAGITVGLIAAVLLQYMLDAPLRGLFYGGELSQPLLLVGVALAVAATALFATWVPARRATKVEPTVALRSE
ncbi:MAG TPA: ABC transporter permease [Kofleriaceae bacterium]